MAVSDTNVDTPYLETSYGDDWETLPAGSAPVLRNLDRDDWQRPSSGEIGHAKRR